MSEKKSEKSFLKKTSDIIAWLCWIFLAWMFFMAFHDDYERNLRFLFNIFPDSALWVIFLYLAPFLIIWIIFKLLCKGLHVKFGAKDLSVKERDAAFGKRLFSPGKNPYLKFFLINTGLGAFVIYLIAIILSDMFEGKAWPWFLSLPDGVQLGVGLILFVIILGMIHKSTNELVKRAKMDPDESGPSS